MKKIEEWQRKLRKESNKKTELIGFKCSKNYRAFLEDVQYEKDLNSISDAIRYIVRDFAKRHKMLDQIENPDRTANLFGKESIKGNK